MSASPERAPNFELPNCYHCGGIVVHSDLSLDCTSGCAAKFRASRLMDARPEFAGCGDGWCALCFLFRSRVRFDPNEDR